MVAFFSTLVALFSTLDELDPLSVIGARALRHVNRLPVMIRKVRFPLSLSTEQKEAVSRLKGLNYYRKFFFSKAIYS